jgi:hypothetical protein
MIPALDPNTICSLFTAVVHFTEQTYIHGIAPRIARLPRIYRRQRPHHQARPELEQLDWPTGMGRFQGVVVCDPLIGTCVQPTLVQLDWGCTSRSPAQIASVVFDV